MSTTPLQILPSPDFSRLGPLAQLLANVQVTEIMVMGSRDIYAEVGGKLILTPLSFDSDEELMGVIRYIVESVGRRVDAANPICDARLSDGSRVHVAIPPVAVDGPLVNIRRFVRGPLEMADLIRLGSCSESAFGFLKACVMARANIVVSGGTGSGKTTLLNVLSGYIPAEERVVTIEDAAELQLRQHAWRPGRPGRMAKRSRSEISSSRRSGCGRTGWSSERYAVLRPSTCCKR